MKILCLADLHFATSDLQSVYQIEKIKRRFINSNINVADADLILIAGDVFEHTIYSTELNPFDLLFQIFNHKKVVFCLGNHEFAYEYVDDVKNYWSKFQSDYIFCLDIVGNVKVEDYNFVGNVFWYDFSLNHNPLLMKGEIIDGWLDASIKNFNPIKENEKCQKQILNSLDKTCKNILVTHTVPNESLNWFSKDEPMSIYNAYSGNFDFLKQIENKNVEWAICGHTHQKMQKTIHGINCVNIGNDYCFKDNQIKSFMIDTNETNLL